MNYISVIGLEIHAELLTESKIFCACKNSFGGNANERVCPVCAGMPGTLPTLNKNAVTLAVKAGIALDCKVNNYSAFDRKNYFYPDLPKAYQITQARYPICTEGSIEIKGKNIRINRIHIEEDAGKLIHDNESDVSLADFNRCGVPLIEIVTEPDFNTPEEVQEFVEEIALRLKYQDVCDAKMEQGSLRVDVNISLMPEDSKEFGTRTEIKNLNSLKSIKKAIEYEIKRQESLLNRGEKIIQETLRYNDETGETSSLRSKEDAHDYRYFPEPDIPPIFISDSEIDEIKSSMHLTPEARIKLYTTCYKLPLPDAKLIVQDRELSDFYSKTVSIYPGYKLTANLMLVELNRCLNESKNTIAGLKFSPEDFATVMKLCDDKKITNNSAKEIISIMYNSGRNPMEIAETEGLLLSDDTSAIEAAVKAILSENEGCIEDYKNGNTKILAYLMGQVSRKAGKGTNMALAKDILVKILAEDK